jgi:hypothetical protein
MTAVMLMRRFLSSLSACAVGFSSAAMPVHCEACTIPVFRFALDRWETDKFHLLLPSSVAADPVITDLLRPLRANGRANLDITTDAKSGQSRLLPSRDGGHELWKGDLGEESLRRLLESPARQAIVERVLKGDSVIWVIADRGAEDDAEHARIVKRLKFLEQVAALPLQDPNDPDSQLGPGPPLLLKFSTLRLKLDDPAEQLLLPMLAGPENRVDDGKPFAAAVFGRGRVLGAWSLEMLDDQALEDACMFLIGRCSCRVKNENPGWDLLLNVDWESALKKAANAVMTATLPETIPSAAPTVSSDVTPPVETSKTEPVSVTTTTFAVSKVISWKQMAVWGAGLAAALCAAALIIMHQKK